MLVRLFDLLYLPLAAAYLPILLYQMIALKKNRRGWGERFGFIRPRVSKRPCVWIHAVSLGEVNATRSLVAEIERRLPAYEIAISTTTDTGHAAARKHYEPKHVFRYPLDFSFIVNRVMRRIRPDAIVLMELEVWPNLIAIARARGIPILVANGRVTAERSMRRFQLPLVRGVARRMFGAITWAGAQNEVYAERFRKLGVPSERVVVTGTMKYDTALVADSIPGDEALAEAMNIDRAAPLLVAGSTGPGEEEMLLDAYAALREDAPALQLAIIPRKPERFDEVARMIESRGHTCIRRSTTPDLTGQAAREARRQRSVEMVKRRRETSGGDDAADRPILLGDTMGELRKFYALADVVFVGRSLVPMGGSDLMEGAGLGKAMCFGPYTENFADVAEKLTTADAAIQMASPGALAETLRRLLADPDAAKAMGEAAQQVVRSNVGATARTVDLLCEALGMRADHPASAISTEKISAAAQS